MKNFTLLLFILFIAGAPWYAAAQPNYSPAAFHNAVFFKNTGATYEIRDDNLANGYLDEILSQDFTIEFWVKGLKNTRPGTRIVHSNMFGMNYALGPDEHGNMGLGLWFQIDSYDNTGWPYPEGMDMDGIFYHSLSSQLPNNSDWIHVAIVKNINYHFLSDPLYPLDPRIDTRQMGMYINGVLVAHGMAPAVETTVFPEYLGIGDYDAQYLKIDEFRLWKKPLVRSEIEANMNNEVDKNAGNLALYYDFNTPGNPAPSALPNLSRGIGSPTTEQNPDAFKAELFLNGGTPPVVSADKVYVSVSDGAWNDPATWGGEVPQPGEVIKIAHNIVLDTDREAGGIELNGGMLDLNGHRLLVQSPPSGGSATSYIKTGNGGQLDLNTTLRLGAQVPIGDENYNPLFVQQPSYTPQLISFRTSESLDELNISDAMPAVKNVWNITPANENITANDPLTVSMYWWPGQEKNGFNRSLAAVANFHDGEWIYLTPDNISPNPENGMYHLTVNANQFSPFVPLNGNMILPLRLLSFEANKAGNNTAGLQWRTAQEINVSHFELERSADGKTFSRLAVIQALNTQGTHRYAYNDRDPVTGHNFYRLKMVDIDGRMEYSNIVRLAFDNNLVLSVLPVPAQNTITVKTSGQFKQLVIADMNGRIVLRKNITKPNEEVDISGLPKGMYIIRVSDGNTIRAEKFIKQ